MAVNYNRWSVLVAIQRRLDDQLIGVYEAVLARNALQKLYPSAFTGMALGGPTDVWVIALAGHLQSLIDGNESKSGDEDWLNVWLAQRPTERLVAKNEVDKLLKSSQGLGEQVVCRRDTE